MSLLESCFYRFDEFDKYKMTNKQRKERMKTNFLACWNAGNFQKMVLHECMCCFKAFKTKLHQMLFVYLLAHFVDLDDCKMCPLGGR